MDIRMNGKNVVVSMALAGLLVAGGANIAYANSNPMATGTASESRTYGYLVGQQENVDRKEQYSVIADFTTDEEREAYFEQQSIGGGGTYSEAQQLDEESQVVAGVIDQETADAIAAFASQKHDSIHDWHESLDGIFIIGEYGGICSSGGL